MALRTLSMFAGIAGLDLGLRRAVPDARTVCYVEREIYCAAVLAARIADGDLDDAPIWSDVTTFDPVPWCGVVDCVTAGFPCTDISCAGKRKGITGKASSMWDHVARIAAVTRPRMLILENVAALCSAP